MYYIWIYMEKNNNYIYIKNNENIDTYANFLTQKIEELNQINIYSKFSPDDFKKILMQKKEEINQTTKHFEMIFEKLKNLKILIICHGKKKHSNVYIKFFKFLFEDDVSSDLWKFLNIDYFDIECDLEDTKRCKNDWWNLIKNHYDYIINIYCFGLFLFTENVEFYSDMFHINVGQIFDKCKKKFRYIFTIHGENKINNVFNKNINAKFI